MPGVDPKVVGALLQVGGKVVMKKVEGFVEKVGQGERYSEADLRVAAQMIQEYMEMAPMFVGQFLSKIAEVSKAADDEALKRLEFLATKFEDNPEIQKLVIEETIRAQGQRAVEIWRTGEKVILATVASGTLIGCAWIFRPDRRSWWEKMVG